MPTLPQQIPALSPGTHLDPDDGACLMEVVSILAGEDFTDHPACTDPVLASLARLVNDEMTDPARQSLAPLAQRLAGGRGDALGRVSAAVVVAVTTATLTRVEPQRGLARHHRRALRRAEHLARPPSGRAHAIDRVITALYARGPAQHALMSCVRSLRGWSPMERDTALADLLRVGLAAAEVELGQSATCHEDGRGERAALSGLSPTPNVSGVRP